MGTLPGRSAHQACGAVRPGDRPAAFCEGRQEEGHPIQQSDSVLVREPELGAENFRKGVERKMKVWKIYAPSEEGDYSLCVGLVLDQNGSHTESEVLSAWNNANPSYQGDHAAAGPYMGPVSTRVILMLRPIGATSSKTRTRA